MIKKNKRLVCLTSVVILLPILGGLVLWGRLPEKMPIHWNFSGEVDGWCGKPFGVLFIPLFLFAMHWFVIGCMCLDPKSKNIRGKGLGLPLWMMPVFSNAMAAFLYASALGVGITIGTFLSLGFGLMYLLVGNNLPKCQPNYTVGIRIPWTLDNEEVWRKTHRLAGKVWVLGGALLLVLPFSWWLFLAVAVGNTAAPAVYSMYLSKKLQ